MEQPMPTHRGYEVGSVGDHLRSSRVFAVLPPVRPIAYCLEWLGQSRDSTFESTDAKEKQNEHLDNIIRGSTNSLDRWVQRVPCSRRFNPLVVGVRGDLSNPTLCARQTNCLMQTVGCGQPEA